jgi:hypothetical protein
MTYNFEAAQQAFEQIKQTEHEKKMDSDEFYRKFAAFTEKNYGKEALLGLCKIESDVGRLSHENLIKCVVMESISKKFRLHIEQSTLQLCRTTIEDMKSVVQASLFKLQDLGIVCEFGSTSHSKDYKTLTTEVLVQPGVEFQLFVDIK